MTTDIVPARPASLPGIMPDVTGEALDRLARWVESAGHAHKLVAPLVGTPWVPAAYQPWGGKPPARPTEEETARAYETAVASATAAVLYGSSLGIDPLMALQQVYVVHGRPGLYAKMMVALVQSRGHEVWTEDLTDTRAVVCGKRKGSSHVERITVTMDMARRAKWTGNSKYQETPQDMLWARAAGRVCDRIASDVIKGIATVEQIEDEAIQATATAGTTTRTVAPRKTAPAAIEAAEEPALAPEPTPAPATVEAEPVHELGDAPASTEPLITSAQSKLLHTLLGKTGRADRATGLKYLSLFLRRDVTTTKTMTKREATDAIDDLEAQTRAAADEPELEPDGAAWPEVAQPPLEP